MKTVAVFAIIFGCFAVLYPKIFHPMLLHLLGMSPSRRSADDMSKNCVNLFDFSSFAFASIENPINTGTVKCGMRNIDAEWQ